MTNKNRNANKKKGGGNEPNQRYSNSNKSYNKRSVNRKNLQDRNEIAEYDKGFRSGVADKDTCMKNRKKGPNDGSWYVPNQQLMKDVASIPFGTPLGLPISKEFDTTLGDVPFHYDARAIPGIMVYDVLPTVGKASDALDPINLAGTKMFTELQQKTGRPPSYEMADVLQYDIAITSAYSFYVWMTRIYGTMNMYDPSNWYKPQALVTAMKVDFESIRDNMADFRAGINEFAYRLASFPLPNNIDYIAREVFLYEGIYMDADSLKAQLSFYNPIGFYQWNEPTKSSPTATVTFRLWNLYDQDGDMSRHIVSSGNYHTYQDILDFGNQLLEPLRSSQDVAIMAADMVNQFGASSMYTVNPISETYTVTPTYSKEILMQMENAYIYPTPDDVSITIGQNVSINGGWLTADYKIYPIYNNFGSFNTKGSINNIMYAAYNYKMFRKQDITLNAHYLEPTPEDVMVMTRLSGNGDVVVGKTTVEGTTTWYYVPELLSSEICVGATYYILANDINATGYDSEKVYLMASRMETMNVLTVVEMSGSGNKLKDTLGYLEDVAALEAFDWAPAIQSCTVPETPTAPIMSGVSISSPQLDYENFTTISERTLKQINDIAMLGLFTIK